MRVLAGVMMAALALIGAQHARAIGPSLSTDASTGVLVGSGMTSLWGGVGAQGQVPVQAGSLLQLGARIQLAGGFTTSFVSVAPVVALKAEVAPELVLFVDASGDAAIELADPGLAPHGRITGGGYYRRQGVYLFAEVFGPREWRPTAWAFGLGYTTRLM